MNARLRPVHAGVVAIGVVLGLWASSASAQGSGSLGGYGAGADGALGMGNGGAMVIPYGGMTEGFMPVRMGGGSSLAFRPRTGAAMSPSRTSFSLSPMSGGMGRGLGPRSTMSGSMGSRSGIGLGGNPSRLGSGGRGMGVMPPSFAYPFRQPPSLLTPSTVGTGMSM